MSPQTPDSPPGIALVPVTDLCHELRTVIGAISGLIQMADQRTQSPEASELLCVALQQADYMTTLVSNTVEVLRDGSAMGTPVSTAFDPAQLLQSSVAAFTPQATLRNIRLTMHLAPGLPEKAQGDPTRLRQIVNNLLGNAIKFTHEGGVTVQGNWRRLRTDPRRVELILTVTDTGIGFDQRIAEKLFLPYVQANPQIATQYGGTGLGLAITRRLVESMDGSIQIRSAPGLGTTFEVRIPIIS